MGLTFLSTHPGRGKVFMVDQDGPSSSGGRRRIDIEQLLNSEAEGGKVPWTQQDDFGRSMAAAPILSDMDNGRTRLEMDTEAPTERSAGLKRNRQDLDEKHCGGRKQPTMPDPQRGDKTAARLTMEKKPNGFLKLTSKKRGGSAMQQQSKCVAGSGGRKRRLLSPDSEGEKIEWDEFSDDESESIKEAHCADSSRRRANPYPEWTSKLRARNAPQSPKNGGSISVFVSVPGSRIISLCMDPSDSIGVLQKAIEEKEAIPVDKQFLVFNGRPLEEGTLTKYGVGNDSVIQLYPHLPGGGSDIAEQETKSKRADSATLEDGATAPESMAFNLIEKIRTGLKLPAQAKVVTQEIASNSQGIMIKLSITFQEEHSFTSGGDVLLTCNSPTCFAKGKERKVFTLDKETKTKIGAICAAWCSAPPSPPSPAKKRQRVPEPLHTGASSSSDQTPPPPENPEPQLDAKAYQRQLFQPDVSISLPKLNGCKYKDLMYKLALLFPLPDTAFLNWNKYGSDVPRETDLHVHPGIFCDGFGLRYLKSKEDLKGKSASEDIEDAKVAIAAGFGKACRKLVSDVALQIERKHGLRSPNESDLDLEPSADFKQDLRIKNVPSATQHEDEIVFASLRQMALMWRREKSISKREGFKIEHAPYGYNDVPENYSNSTRKRNGTDVELGDALYLVRREEANGLHCFTFRLGGVDAKWSREYMEKMSTCLSSNPRVRAAFKDQRMRDCGIGRIEIRVFGPAVAPLDDVRALFAQILSRFKPALLYHTSVRAKMEAYSEILTKTLFLWDPLASPVHMFSVNSITRKVAGHSIDLYKAYNTPAQALKMMQLTSPNGDIIFALVTYTLHDKERTKAVAVELKEAVELIQGNMPRNEGDFKKLPLVRRFAEAFPNQDENFVSGVHVHCACYRRELHAPSILAFNGHCGINKVLTDRVARAEFKQGRSLVAEEELCTDWMRTKDKLVNYDPIVIASDAQREEYNPKWFEVGLGNKVQWLTCADTRLPPKNHRERSREILSLPPSSYPIMGYR
eukprot:g60985.t1